MRPLRLEVKGFTAFRDPAEIDFAELDVFAISGPTGSGKSSLLDAMTYALYGRVERVGDRVGQLISQGQPRMAVTLDFEVGQERYRVTRTTQAKGTTLIQLERWDGSEWQQAGDGSGKVRSADPMIREIVGLDYDGFTRSVLLPQGRFSEFLTGDPKKRRDILTELLGLSLFERMAQRANAISKEAKLRAGFTRQRLEEDFASVSADALKEARAVAEAAKERQAGLEDAREQIGKLRQRWQEAETSVEMLRSCAREFVAVAGSATRVAEEVRDLGRKAEEVEGQLARAGGERAAAEAEVTEARAARAEAERTASAKDLAEARFSAHALADTTRTIEARRTALATAETAASDLATRGELAATALTAAAERVALRETELEAAERALDEAQHANLVAAVSAGLKAGDPCPVCGRPLEETPSAAGDGALSKAEEARDGARKVLETARREQIEAEREAEAVHRALTANATDRAGLEDELARMTQGARAHRERLLATFGEPLPDDPSAAVDERERALETLLAAERRAEADLARALAEGQAAELDRKSVALDLSARHEKLSASHAPLFELASKALGQRTAPPKIPPPPAATEPDALAEFGNRLAEAMSTFADRLESEAEARSSSEADLLNEAAAVIGGLVPLEPRLDHLARSIEDACRTATAEAATGHDRAVALAEQLDRKRELLEDVKRLDHRAAVFHALGLELKADHLIAFLQEEALQLLAAAASDRLLELSGGRYRLNCRAGDEFFVVDTWNGDEERSARTLSGGETFLASLALALALAEQVRSLATTDRARLDSLFLDEGFGTLDQDTLSTVEGAIEQLGADGRLIGIITHVRELAEQFPRIEVEKSPRGSKLRLVPA